MTRTRRPASAPRTLQRQPRRRPRRPASAAEVWDAARPAIALITAVHTGTEVGQAEILDGYPRELVLQAMTCMATGFLRALAHAEPDRDEIVTGLLRHIGKHAAEEAGR